MFRVADAVTATRYVSFQEIECEAVFLTGAESVLNSMVIEKDTRSVRDMRNSRLAEEPVP